MRQKEHSEPEELTETVQVVEVSFSGQEYRGRQALCAGLRDGNPHRVKDEVPWRVEGGQPHWVKGETPCPGRVDALRQFVVGIT